MDLWFVDRRQAVLAWGLEYKMLREEKKKRKGSRTERRESGAYIHTRSCYDSYWWLITSTTSDSPNGDPRTERQEEPWLMHSSHSHTSCQHINISIIRTSSHHSNTIITQVSYSSSVSTHHYHDSLVCIWHRENSSARHQSQEFRDNTYLERHENTSWHYSLSRVELLRD